MQFGRRRGQVLLTSVVAASLSISACGTDESPEVSSPNSISEATTANSVDETTPVETELPPDVTASGVLLAATLIAAGNIEDAVASGLVTPAEVDEARAAIESGTLDRWVALAEG